MQFNKKFPTVVLLLAGLILAAYIAQRVPGQIDLTEGDLYSLSDGSRAIVSGLEEPVHLNLYFSRSLEGLPIRLKNFATQVEDLLHQYEKAGEGMVRVEVIDPRPDTEQEEAAIRTGLNRQAMQDGSSLFFGLEAVQGDNTAVIPLFSFNRESYLEYDISELIHEVQLIDKPVVGILSSLPVSGTPTPQAMGRQAPDKWIFLQQLERSYSTQILQPTAEIPGTLDLLVVMHPQDLDDQRLFEIDQLLLSGTPVLALVDPSSFFQYSTQQQQQMPGMPMPSTSSSLNAIFQANGIVFSNTQLVGDMELAATVSEHAGTPPIQYPIWLSLSAKESASPIVSNLEDLLFIESGCLQLTDESTLTMTPLVSSTEGSSLLDARMARYIPPDRIGASLTGEPQERVLAAVFEGNFKTAFLTGRPQSEEEGESTGDEPEPFLVSSKTGKSILMVVGDSDFLSNQFTVRMINLLGMQSATPVNDNLSFFFNAVDTLTGSPELISLRGKGQTSRPFTVVEKMQQDAQSEYQEQLVQLEDRLRDVQQQLRELQSQQTQEQLLVASPETRKAIEEYRQEEVQVRSELRNIRKKLREDVQALDLRLAMINLLLVPCLIITGGIIYFWKFHRA